VICGHNRKVETRLRALRRPAPIFVEGFTKDVPRYMQLADYFIGKPGPGSISEAIAMRLPVIVERNAWTLPQERYNADWIREYRVGVVLSSFRRIGEAIAELLEPGRIDEFRVNAAKMNNRAVFEIPDVLDKVLAEARKNPTPPA
jgi:UDP-N-acetylglucosamine:LPS N-acetylglucosamine transferase